MMGPDDDDQSVLSRTNEGKTDRREPVTTNPSHGITAGSLLGYKQSEGELYFNSDGDPSSDDTDRISLWSGDGIVHAGVAAGGSWTQLSDKYCESSSHIGTLQSMADATARCLADPSCVYILYPRADGQ